MATFAGGLAAAGVLGRGLGRDAHEHTRIDPRHARARDVQGGPHNRARPGHELHPGAALAPGFGRLLAWTLGAAGLNDFLQTAFVALANKSDELAEQVS